MTCCPTRAASNWSTTKATCGVRLSATGRVQATVGGAGIATSEGAAASQNVAFANGRALVTARYADAGSLCLSMKDDTTGNPALRAAASTRATDPVDTTLLTTEVP